MTDTLNLAVIGGDGIGPEVVAQGLKVLDAATAAGGLKVSTTEYDLGARRWHATGETLPASVLEELKGHDAILLGAIGDPSVPSGVLERGVLLPIRFALEHYVNLRPAKLFPGVRSPLDVQRVALDGIDFVVVREGTEGLYVGNGGSLRTGTPNEIATEVSVNTRFGVERVVRDAFGRAQARPRKHLTLVHKHNVLTYAGHPGVTVEEVGTSSPTSRPPTSTSTPRPSSSPRTPAGSTSSSPTTSSATSSPTSPAPSSAASGSRPAATSTRSGRTPSMFEPVHGSARHRRSGQGRPHRHRARSRCCSTTSAE